MPLSEEELRLLDQMERALVEEDPKFASTLRGTSLRRSARRRAIVSGVVFVLGIAILMTGAVTQTPVIGIVGFVVMLASATIGLTAIRSQQGVGNDTRTSPHPSGGLSSVGGGRRSGRRSRRTVRNSSSGSFMERLEERWRRRRDNGSGW